MDLKHSTIHHPSSNWVVEMVTEMVKDWTFGLVWGWGWGWEMVKGTV